LENVIAQGYEEELFYSLLAKEKGKRYLSYIYDPSNIDTGPNVDFFTI
jgi:hypothetical protein